MRVGNTDQRLTWESEELGIPGRDKQVNLQGQGSFLHQAYILIYSYKQYAFGQPSELIFKDLDCPES